VLQLVMASYSARLHGHVTDAADGPVGFSVLISLAASLHLAFVSSVTNVGGGDGWENSESLCLPVTDAKSHSEEEGFHCDQCGLEVGWVVVPQPTIVGIKAGPGGHTL